MNKIMMTPEELVAVKRWLTHQIEHGGLDTKNTIALKGQLDEADRLLTEMNPPKPSLRLRELKALRVGLMAAFDREQLSAEDKGEVYSWVWGIMSILDAEILNRLKNPEAGDSNEQAISFDNLMSKITFEPIKLALIIKLFGATISLEQRMSIDFAVGALYSISRRLEQQDKELLQDLCVDLIRKFSVQGFEAEDILKEVEARKASTREP